MFVLNKDRIVEWPVTIEEPADGGKTELHEVSVQYRLIKQSDYDAAFEQGQDAGVLRQVVAGWNGFSRAVGPGAETMLFSAEALEQLIEVPYVRRALVLGYVECVRGARRKNSPAPAATGPAARPNGAKPAAA